MLLALLALAAPAAAQDFITVWGGYQPPAAVETDIANDADLRFSGWGGRITAPPIRFADRRLMWINGLSASVGYPGLSVDLPDDTRNDMISIVWQATLVAELSERWRAAALVAPSLQSNFEVALSGRDFRVQALGLVSYETGETTQVGLGFGYANLFGVPRPFPVLQFRTEQERWRANLLLPQEASIWYELVDDGLALGAMATVSGGYFHRGNDDPTAPEDVFIRYSLGSIGPALEGFVGPLRLRGEVGLAALRRFDIFQDDDPLVDFELERGLAARVTLGFTPGRGTDAPSIPGL